MHGELALAHLRCVLTRGTSMAPDFEAYRSAVVKVLGGQAMSIFALDEETRRLQCVDSTGFEKITDPSQAYYDLDADRESYTCWLARNPGSVLRMNGGPGDDEGLTARGLPPAPSTRCRERVSQDASYHRRLLAASVWRDHGEAGEATGVLRVLRSGAACPFTAADEHVLAVLAQAARPLFQTRRFFQQELISPTLVGPTLARVEEVLQRAVAGLAPPAFQASVFVRSSEARPEYRRYAYHSPWHQFQPEGLVAEPPDDLVGPNGWLYPSKVAVTPCTQGDGRVCTRVYVPLDVWSGPYLVESLCAFDFPAEVPLQRREVATPIFRTAARVAAVWSTNGWQADRPLPDSELVAGFFAYLTTDDAMKLVRPELRDLCEPGGGSHRDTLEACGDPMLARFGVRLSRDGARCAIPLALGPFRVAELHCGLGAGLAAALGEFAGASARRNSPPARDEEQRAQAVFERLRVVVANAAGAWCRLVASHPVLWDVAFETERREGQTILWEERIQRRQPVEPAGPAGTTGEAGSTAARHLAQTK